MTRADRIDLLVRFGIATLLALFLAPVVGWLSDEKFHRILTRTFQATFLLVLVWPNPPWVWLGKVREMGARGPGRLSRFFSGFLLAAALFGLLLAVSWALGGRTWRTDPLPNKPFASHLFGAGVAALVASLAEEILFRGYLRRKLSGLLSALLYAVAHYFRPLNGSAPAGPEFDPWLGFTRYGEMLQGFTELRNITLGVLSLFLIAMALNRMAQRTGTLWMGIGVHSGMIFTVELYRRWFYDWPAGEEWPGSNMWIFGGGRLHDGLLGCGVAALLWLIAAKAPLPRRLSKAAT